MEPEGVAMAAFPARDRDPHFDHWQKILADDTVITKTIEVDGNVGGSAVAWTQDGHREIGYWLGKEYWGKGVATAALSQFVKIVSERPLFAWVAEHNAGSIRVLEKCGFTRAAHQPPRSPGEVPYVVMELLYRDA